MFIRFVKIKKKNIWMVRNRASNCMYSFWWTFNAKLFRFIYA